MANESESSPVAVIIGSATGIGAELANVAKDRGYRLALADQKQIEREDCELDQQLDVRYFEEVDKFADRVFDEFGRVDLLVNNAGIMRPGRIWEQPIEHLKAVMDINFGGVLNGIRAFVPRILKVGNACRVVNTASLAGLIPAPTIASYCISKHAVVALSETLAIDLQKVKSNISVSVICPGAVKTNIMDSAEEALSESPDSSAMAQVKKMSYGLNAMGNDPKIVAQTIFSEIDKGTFCIWATGESPEPFLSRCNALAKGESAGFTQWGHEK